MVAPLSSAHCRCIVLPLLLVGCVLPEELCGGWLLLASDYLKELRPLQVSAAFVVGHELSAGPG